MSECRWDAETKTYRKPDGEECETPKREHCSARKTCSNHLDWGQLTCPTCVGRVRTKIRHIAERAPLMATAALESRRIDSEAANMAGPGVDPRAWSEHRLAAIPHLDHWLQQGRISESQYEFARDLLDDDEYHPYNVLTRWHMMLAEDYSHDLPDRMTIARSAAYLDRQLSTVAHDEGQEFRLLATEVSTCLSRMDSELRIKPFPQQGVPCPDCQAEFKTAGIKRAADRLVRHYAHWCEDETCEKVHYADDRDDTWVCPRNPAHNWDMTGYERIQDRRATPRACA